MTGFTGSEVVTLELLQRFSELGWSITLQSPAVSEPMQEHLEKIPRLTVTAPGNLFSSIDAFDLLWCHHQIVPIEVLHRGRDDEWITPTIFHHMSPYVDLESPFLPRVEVALASKVLYNSPETQQAVNERFFDAAVVDEHIFANPAPDRFRSLPGSRGTERRLERLLLVSNHVPTEVAKAMKLLEKNDVRIQHIGRKGHKYRLVEPRDIHRSSAVLTIGKTAQYSLVGGVPVFCYDHFGGPGYLSPLNFELAAHNNFSGRGFPRKSATAIVDELIGGFMNASLFAGTIARSPTVDRYSLSHQVDLILSDLRRPTAERRRVAAKMDWEAAIATRKMLDSLWTSNWSMHQSASWKVTAPLRRMKEMLRKSL